MWKQSPPLDRLSVPLLLIPAIASGEEVPAPATGGPVRVTPLAGDHDLHIQQPANVAGLIRAALSDGFFA